MPTLHVMCLTRQKQEARDVAERTAISDPDAIADYIMSEAADAVRIGLESYREENSEPGRYKKRGA